MGASGLSLASQCLSISHFVLFQCSSLTKIVRQVGQACATVFTTSSLDSVVHLSEEVENAARTVPRAMVFSFIFNIPMTFLVAVTFCFNVGSPQEALAGPLPPFMHILRRSVESPNATAAFTVLVLGLLCIVAVNSLAAASRQAFAFA